MTTLFLAPDDLLHLVPFGALVDDGDRYLIETYRCAYLSGGRDLLRPARPLGQGTVVFAGPDYNLPPERGKPADPAAPAPHGPAVRAPRQSFWRALPGAQAEADDLRTLLAGGPYAPLVVYQGPEALEERLKAVRSPRVLHLATHGFFLAPESSSDQPPAGGLRGPEARLRAADNPLLRSGLVLAGANIPVLPTADSQSVEDGWVTAEEVALLDLRGTELVVLSACERGLGDVRAGEGVYGLRRAFLYAGARSLVTSLFQVPDEQTRTLMKSFYAGLRAGRGKLEALHAAQLQLLEERRQPPGADRPDQPRPAHPIYWAGFILVGDPG